MITRSVPTAEGMHAFGLSLAAELRAGDLLVLDGPLGAGKTTFTRGLGEGLGIRGTVTSPTFVLARTHPSVVGGPALVHVDAYRLSDPMELDDLDIDYAHSVVVVEWGAGMLDGVSESWLELRLQRPMGAGDEQSGAESETESEADEPRTVTIAGFGPRWAGTEYAGTEYAGIPDAEPGAEPGAEPSA
ncbi:tRNA (adenosine(37)-N6)-threonylcarbamoyltransferase complex ATPase subunit type 1 TsaE [Microterricola viridarii]|uniref:tRNA threonylcarbamoyladenosine biosynthesis protein TsaE n=1 Tax=Microterricola viridarii TaxID=412690 RepID=A0A1H1Q5X9_9MICO|nr:tRNA threonylcarbamoyladenosine biosynthesis protein TsaE [Microterricola viridarii]